MSGERQKSVVKWFNNKKGFGFIERSEAEGGDVFVHYNNIRGDGFRALEDGDRVEYTLVKGDKGMQAEDVVLLDD